MEPIIQWMQSSPFSAVLIFLALFGVAILLGGAAWWLGRQRKRSDEREEMMAELRRRVERLGIGTVWQTPLFQVDVYGVRGEVNDFDIRCEIWDKASRDLFRLSIYFPRSTRQQCTLRSERRPTLKPLGQITAIEVGDEAFDQRFQLRGPEQGSEVIKELFDQELRDRLMKLVEDCDGLRIGDRSLYLYREAPVSPAEVERFLQDGLAAAAKYFQRSRKVGPTTENTDITYEMAAIDVLGRDGDDRRIGTSFPDGSADHESIGDDDSSSADEAPASAPSS